MRYLVCPPIVDSTGVTLGATPLPPLAEKFTTGGLLTISVVPKL